MHRSSQAMSLPRLRMICMPSLSCRTSSGVLPCTMHQYWEDTSGMWLMVKYFCRASSEAVVPALLAETTQAPGLWERAAEPE